MNKEEIRRLIDDGYLLLIDPKEGKRKIDSLKSQIKSLKGNIKSINHTSMGRYYDIKAKEKQIAKLKRKIAYLKDKHEVNNYCKDDVIVTKIAVEQTRAMKAEKALDEIKQHIKNKVRKSFEVDWGISSNRGDRLMTETVVELQVIEAMIDEARGFYE